MIFKIPKIQEEILYLPHHNQCLELHKVKDLIIQLVVNRLNNMIIINKLEKKKKNELNIKNDSLIY